MLARFDEAAAARERGRPAVARAHWRRLCRLLARLHRADEGRSRDRGCLPPPLLRLRRGGRAVGFLQTFAPLLGRSLCKLGRHDEAEPLAELGRTSTRPRRTSSRRHSGGRCRRSSTRTAANTRKRRRLAREAVAVLEPTDALNIQGDALSDLAEVLHAAGRSEAADGAYAEASARYERKHNLAQVAQVRERLAELHRVGLST